MDDQVLYLSADKEYLLDENKEIVAVKKEKDGKVFYQSPDLDSKGKICIGWKSKKVCIEYNNNHICASWGEVQICCEWSLSQKN